MASEQVLVPKSVLIELLKSLDGSKRVIKDLLK